MLYIFYIYIFLYLQQPQKLATPFSSLTAFISCFLLFLFVAHLFENCLRFLSHSQSENNSVWGHLSQLLHFASCMSVESLSQELTFTINSFTHLYDKEREEEKKMFKPQEPIQYPVIIQIPALSEASTTEHPWRPFP